MSEEQQVYATLVEIREEPTALYKILKIANLVSGGGEAKIAIAEGYVTLNGEVETQKRKKIVAGDLIYFNEQYLQIAIIGETEDYEIVEEPLAKSKARTESQKKEPSLKGKKPRRAISF
ncbi:RNA-binding S4 domain-containing protein [Psychromonas hadalis]|uniref:RNA-binding S4 domain-containing protein n=1 Tax=Psychromonas hadalis TaxID=211669 RepID=UPI0003B6BA0E|nr:RNA-binding S4 domain-containing protein [Psychromonas hadalis]